MEQVLRLNDKVNEWDMLVCHDLMSNSKQSGVSTTSTLTPESIIKLGRVCLSTVGPYALYGNSIVEACVTHG